MKDIITHLKAQRAARPREQHLRIDTRKVDALVEAVEKMILEGIEKDNTIRRLRDALNTK